MNDSANDILKRACPVIQYFGVTRKNTNRVGVNKTDDIFAASFIRETAAAHVRQGQSGERSD